MATMSREDQSFKRAFILSVSVHLALLVFVLISPFLPKAKRKGMVHYVNVVSLGGGGGGTTLSGGSPPPASTESQLAETALPPRESLRDLTTPQNLQQKRPPSLTYPVDKPKKDRTPQKPKKTSIKKAPPKSSRSQKAAPTSGTGSGTGSGFRVGIGDGLGGGYGFGSEYASQIGLSTFPFNYYLQNIHSQISSNWDTFLIRSGVKENVHVTVTFKIYRDGRISEPQYLERSGLITMDLSAIRAIRNTTFPPLPREYKDEYLQINLIFEYTK